MFPLIYYHDTQVLKSLTKLIGNICSTFYLFIYFQFLKIIWSEDKPEYYSTFFFFYKQIKQGTLM